MHIEIDKEEEEEEEEECFGRNCEVLWDWAERVNVRHMRCHAVAIKFGSIKDPTHSCLLPKSSFQRKNVLPPPWRPDSESIDKWLMLYEKWHWTFYDYLFIYLFFSWSWSWSVIAGHCTQRMGMGTQVFSHFAIEAQRFLPLMHTNGVCVYRYIFNFNRFCSCYNAFRHYIESVLLAHTTPSGLACVVRAHCTIDCSQFPNGEISCMNEHIEHKPQKQCTKKMRSQNGKEMKCVQTK